MSTEKTTKALQAAKAALEGVSQCVGADEVVHCFHCDEWMWDAVWPAHGNPDCEVGKALRLIEEALAAIPAR